MNSNMPSKAHVLVIEDDAEIRELVRLVFTKEGFTVTAVADAERGIPTARKEHPDAILLDCMLPGIDGLETLKRFKKDRETSSIPVVMVTAKGEDADIVAALELGAADYVTKPFSPRVLVARTKNALRRFDEADDESPVVSASGIELDRDRHSATVDGQMLDLSSTEFDLLDYLIRNRGMALSRSKIIDSIRGHDYPVTDRSVDVHILSIRRKLGAKGDEIETLRGVGYRFRERE